MESNKRKEYEQILTDKYSCLCMKVKKYIFFVGVGVF
jgi:hypothetical protein